MSPLDLTGKEPPKVEAPAKRGRPTKAKRGEDVRSKLASGVDKLAKIAARRGDEELATILREDGPAMAEFLGKLAARSAPAAKAIGVLVLALEPIDAFGRLARLLLERLRQRRRELFGEEGEPEPVAEPEPAGGAVFA